MATKATSTTHRRVAEPEAPADPAAQPEQPSQSMPAMRLDLLDPRSLILDRNIRTDAQLDVEFVDSIRERGVMAPILAVQTEQGVQVRHGQRRTLGAIQAGRHPVPVVVIDSPDGDEVERILSQWDENFHRRGLGVADQVGVAAQLAAFGLPAADIAAKLRTTKTVVEQALAVAGSELARKAAPRFDLTLEQSAAIAEFESDPETVKLLVAAAHGGPVSFEHALQQARDTRTTAEQIAAIEAELTGKGIRLLTGSERFAPKAQRLDRLTAETATRKPITPAKHKNCPGNAAYVQVIAWQKTVEAVHVCTDWKAHRHLDRYGPHSTVADAPVLTEAEAEALAEKERQKRRTVIANNKAWDSATSVRRRFVQTFLTRKTPAKGSAAFVAGELLLGSWEIQRAMERGSRTLRELLGHKDHDALKKAAAAAANATDARAQVLTLAVALAAIAESMTRDTWRNPSSAAKRYLSFLTQHGYQLSDVEQLVIGKPKPTRKASSTKAATEAATTAETGLAAPGTAA